MSALRLLWPALLSLSITAGLSACGAATGPISRDAGSPDAADASRTDAGTDDAAAHDSGGPRPCTTSSDCSGAGEMCLGGHCTVLLI